MDDVKEAIDTMKRHLANRPDEKLIKGYQRAMKDYEETGDEKIKSAADAIKQEIDKRGLSVD